MNFSSHRRVARLLTRLATAIAGFVAVIPVSVYLASAYLSVTHGLDARLDSHAHTLERTISLQPDYWDLNPERLRANFERELTPGEYLQIINRSGKTVIEIGPTPTWHVLLRSQPVYGFGVELGRMNGGQSVVNLLWIALALFGVSLGAAWLIRGPMCRLPLAALAEAESKLRLRDQYQRALLDNFPFAVWLKDDESRFLSVNMKFARTFGADHPDALIGKTDFDIAPSEIAECFRADDRAVQMSRQQKTIEQELLSEGRYTWFETYKAPLVDDQGKVLGTVGFMRDIAARKHNEEELDRHRHRLEVLVDERTAALQVAHDELLETQFAMDSVGIGIRWADARTGRFIYANRAGAEMLGYSVEEMLALSVADIEPNFDAARFKEIDALLLQKGRAQFEAINRAKDGRLSQVEVVLYRHAGNARAAAHVIAFVTDISERKRNEAQLRKLSQAVEQSRAGIVIFGLELAIQYVNPAFVKISGYAEKDLIGRPARFLRTQLHSAQFYEQLWQTIAGGATWIGELASERANGELYWLQASISPILSEAAPQAEILSYVAILDDITERKIIQTQLRESEERFRQAFVHAPIGMAVVSRDGYVTEANPELCRMLGYGAGGINGYPIKQFFVNEFEQLFLDGKMSDESRAPKQAAALEFPGNSCEKLCIHRDGRYIPVVSTMAPIRDADDEPLDFIVQIEDISERKQAQLHDLATGILAAQEADRARLSHELHDQIGQSLTALKITLKRAGQNLDNADKINACLGDGQQMLEQLMIDVRRIAYSLRPSELDQLGLIAALRSHLDKTIRPLGQKVTLAENLGEARLPAGLELCCFRVVQEALTNGLRHAQAALFEVTLNLEASRLILSIKDDGVGFDASRYHSSSESLPSLGLIGMRERVAANGGFLQIHSTLGAGSEVVATFNIKRAS